MTTLEGFRQVKFRPYDLGFVKDSEVLRSGRISEQAIRDFCNGCIKLQQNNICKMGSEAQTRYAARRDCGWAESVEHHVRLTEDGAFLRFKKPQTP